MEQERKRALQLVWKVGGVDTLTLQPPLESCRAEPLGALGTRGRLTEITLLLTGTGSA